MRKVRNMDLRQLLDIKVTLPPRFTLRSGTNSAMRLRWISGEAQVIRINRFSCRGGRRKFSIRLRQIQIERLVKVNLRGEITSRRFSSGSRSRHQNEWGRRMFR